MRVGVYGGSFDPPHVGHVLIAGDACDELRLDRLIVIPAGVQPLKENQPWRAPALHRLEMARLAFAGDPRMEVDTIEIDREGLSFTVDTLEEIARRNPGAELFLLIGRDSYDEMEKWRNPGRIRELATLAILERDTPAGRPVDAAGTVPVTTRRIDVSSTEVRQRVRDGRGISGFVSQGVEGYIRDHGLYSGADASDRIAG